MCDTGGNTKRDKKSEPFLGHWGEKDTRFLKSYLQNNMGEIIYMTKDITTWMRNRQEENICIWYKMGRGWCKEYMADPYQYKNDDPVNKWMMKMKVQFTGKEASRSIKGLATLIE